MEKKYFIQVSMVLLIFLGLSGFVTVQSQASELESEIETQYMLYDDLTIEQKEQIIEGQPKILITHDKESFIFVYLKNQEEIKGSDSEQPNQRASINTNRKNSIQVASEKKGELPKTGSEFENRGFLFGGSLLTMLTVCLLIWKRKHAKQLFVLFLFVGSLGVTSGAEAKEIRLPLTDKERVAKNTLFEKNTILEGYTYVGYLHMYLDDDNKIPPVSVEGFVTIHYIDSQGQSISEKQVLKGIIGEAYTTEVLDIEGYTLAEIKGNQTGTFTEKGQEVTFVYEAIVKDGTVQFSLENRILKEQELVYIYDEEKEEYEKYPVLYYVWDKNDITTKVESVTFSGLVGSIVDISSPYLELFEIYEIIPGLSKYTFVSIYPVYNDDTGEKVDGKEEFYVSINSYDETGQLSLYDTPLYYGEESQTISIYIDKTQPA